jgi:hypothetical protein
MALGISLIKDQLEEVTAYTITDNTGSYDALNNTAGYGAPNPARTDRGNYLLVSKNSYAGVRAYIIVSNNDPLNTLIWTLVSSVDGWHQATLLSFNKWNGSDPFSSSGSPDVVYYTPTNKFYKCIDDNTNIAPDSGSGSDYWEEITDFTEIQQNHSNVEVIDYHFLIDSRISIDITDELYEALSEDFTCKLSLDQASHPLNMIAALEGAHSKMLNDEGADAEQIILSLAECVD